VNKEGAARSLYMFLNMFVNDVEQNKNQSIPLIHTLSHKHTHI